jgi:sulfonate transport system substrate-binding protein
VSLRIALVSLLLSSPSFAEPLRELRLDYATYNPSSLVLKKLGWLEEALGREGTRVTWLFSQGSNKANELLASGSADLASTAGAAALLARTNGVPLKIVYVFSKPEWTALVVPKGSPVKSVAELKGKRIAATRGTDPFFFLLRTLQANGLRQSDVELVNLQHADGRTALERGQVTPGPGSIRIWRPPSSRPARACSSEHRLQHLRHAERTAGVPRGASRGGAAVLAQYERARAWILAHPAEAVQILAEAARLSPDVARKQLTERTVLDRDVGVPGEKLRAALAAVVPILRSEKLVAPGSDPDRALSELLAPGPAQEARR